SGRGLHSALERRSEVKGASRPNLTFHPDSPAHQLDDLCGNGKSQSGAAVVTRRRGVGLSKSFENYIPLIRWYADSGVANGEMQPHIVAVNLFRLHANHHLTALCEFEGVAYQVDDYLSQAPR